MTAPRPVLLLDMSGVVFVNGTRDLVRDLAAETGALPSDLEAFFSGPDSWALRRGEITAEGFWHRVGPRLEKVSGLQPEIVRRRWIDAFVPHEGMLDLVAEIASLGVVVGAVAETTQERSAELARRHGHERHLVCRFYSFAHGADKRDGGLFRIAAAVLRPADRAVLMVEDDEASAEQARALGFMTAIFADAPSLRCELAAHGVLGRDASR